VAPDNSIVDSNACYLETSARNSIARTSNGDLYVVYNRWNGTNGIWGDIYVSRSTDGGSSWSNQLVYTHATRQQYCPKIAVDSADNIFIVWETKSPTVNDNVKNICLVKGIWNNWGSREMVTDSASEQYAPSIAIDGNDNLHITWYGLGYGTNTTYCQIVYRKRNSNGTYEDITPLTDKAYHQFDPSIAINSSNDIHIVWDGPYWGGANNNYYQIVHIAYSNGWSSPEVVTDNAWSSFVPVLAIDSSDNLHLVYNRAINNVWSDLYQKKTTTWSAAEVVFGDGTHNAYRPCISLDKDNNIYVSGEETGLYSSTIRNIVLRKKTDNNWQSIETISFEPTQQQNSNLLWANYPIINGKKPNVPSASSVMVWMFGATSDL